MGYTQDTRRLILNTPLGENVLLIHLIDGTEGISRLYNYQIDCMADLTETVDFSKLLGQMVSVTIAFDELNGGRVIHGLVHRVSRGENGKFMATYRLDIGPPIWPMTKRTHSRIFQQKSVPDILKEVLKGYDCKYELMGTFEPREYCVQYRETDFDFFSRLCEEEGIYYYFQHEESAVKLVLANTTQSHVAWPYMPKVRYRQNLADAPDPEVIYTFEKAQHLRSGKVTLWDHHSQLPHKNLEGSQVVQPTVTVGKEHHKLDTANSSLELYDFPGGYAARFDGISKGGGDQAANLGKILQDNSRTAGIRMQQESVDAIVLSGQSSFLGMMHGYKFDLSEHPTDDGTYVVTEATVFIPQAGGYEAHDAIDIGNPSIGFRCIPLELPYRPPRLTPKPLIHGSQTAYVVGPGGEEIFTDKYGRVKVQFHWDRDSKADASSSCWIMVGQGSAGNQWGSIWIPRIGQEVIVSFLEGDPDQPIIVGAVYNPGTMPPYSLPDNKTRTIIKTNSSPGGGGFNEIRLEDKKGKEQIFIHGEKDYDLRVKNDYKEIILNERHLKVTSNTSEEIGADLHVTVKGDRNTEIKGNDSLKIGSDYDIKSGTKIAINGGQEVHIKAGMKCIIEAGTQLSFFVGGNFIDINSGGVFIKGTMVNINSGGAKGSGSGASPKSPKAPKEAANSTPGSSTQNAKSYSYSPPGPQALAFQRAAHAGAAFCEI